MARKQTASFFDAYAHEYDHLTAAASRETVHRKEVEAIVARFQPTRVLDAGCATGLTTRLFAAAGVKAVGLDRSAPILAEARRIAAEQGVAVEFVEGQFEKLPKSFDSQFDLIVCLANSIAGVNTEAALLRSLKSFYRSVSPGGRLVLQMLNYAVVREGEIRPVRVTEYNNIVYARYQERIGRKIILHIIRIDRDQAPPSLEVFVHASDNFAPPQVLKAVRAAGFAKVGRFADLALTEPFQPSSRDLVIVANRPVR